MLVRPLAGIRNIVSRRSIGCTGSPSRSKTAASDQKAITASASCCSSPASAPTVAAAVCTRSPFIEPETSIASTTERRVRTRSCTMMSSSSGIGCSASTSIVLSRSISSDPPRYGRLASAPAPRWPVLSLRGRRIESRAAICLARALTMGLASIASALASTSSASSSVEPGADIPGFSVALFGPCDGSVLSTIPAPPLPASNTAGCSSSCFGVRVSGRSVRLFFGVASRLIGVSASTSFHPGSAIAG